MIPLTFQFLMFAVGASKMAFALAFFAWIETRRAQPQVQSMEYRVKTRDR